MAGPNISRANLPINPCVGLDALIREHLAFFFDDPCEDQGVPGEGQCLIFLQVTFLAIFMDICPCQL